MQCGSRTQRQNVLSVSILSYVDCCICILVFSLRSQPCVRACLSSRSLFLAVLLSHFAAVQADAIGKIVLLGIRITQRTCQKGIRVSTLLFGRMIQLVTKGQLSGFYFYDVDASMFSFCLFVRFSTTPTQVVVLIDDLPEKGFILNARQSQPRALARLLFSEARKTNAIWPFQCQHCKSNGV